MVEEYGFDRSIWEPMSDSLIFLQLPLVFRAKREIPCTQQPIHPAMSAVRRMFLCQPGGIDELPIFHTPFLPPQLIAGLRPDLLSRFLISKCFLLLVRSYDGSLMKVCGILSPCRQAGAWKQGRELKGVETGWRGARRSRRAPLQPVSGRAPMHTSPYAAPACRHGERIPGSAPNPIRLIPTAHRARRKQSPQGHTVSIFRGLEAAGAPAGPTVSGGAGFFRLRGRRRSG